MNLYHYIHICFYFVFVQQATCKHERKIASLRTQQQHICKRLRDVETRFLDNDRCLHRVENEMKLLKSNTHDSEVSKSWCMSLQIVALVLNR